MATSLHRVLQHLQQGNSGLKDGQLLARFVAARDETSFAALVQRHGPMVFGVCRRILRDYHDAEDAFQATFLVLARKAGSVVKRDSLGCWLYQVAYHTALEASTANTRRRSREKPMKDMPPPEVTQSEAQDWRPLLDRELNLLPEKYRVAIVLCDLEARTRKDAARLLSISEGTLSSRLARGRTLLAKRLTRCGLALSGGALAVALSQCASAQLSTGLVNLTAKAAALVAAGNTAAVSTTAVLLMKGVMKAMLVKKLRLIACAVLIVAALGAVGIGYQAGGGPGSAQAAPPDKPKNELEALRRENELLKLNLEVVLEKVRAQEVELRELRARDSGLPRRDSGLPRGSGGPGVPGGDSFRPGFRPGDLAPGTPDKPGGNFGTSRPGTGSGGGPPPGAPGLPGSSGVPSGPGPSSDEVLPMVTNPLKGAPARTEPDPVQEAEAALKALREAKNDPVGQWRATEALEKALEKLKQRVNDRN
jgi:RNA polymerase sigma factor (sigma-70 family)